MSQTVIHIGLHKTASTFLQENVWPQLHSFTYLTRPYTQHNHAFNQLQYADDSIYQKDLVLQELNQINTDRLLISDESFSGKPIFFSYINRSLIAKRLKELFPDANIIIFLRDQKDIILSHYSSYIKMPFGTKKLENFFYKTTKNYTYHDYLNHPEIFDKNTLYYNTNDYFIHLDCFLYSHLVKLYSQLFEKCHFFLHEELKSDRAQVIEKLEYILGEKIEVLSTQEKNVSLSYSELEKRRRINQILSPLPNQKLRRVLQKSIKITPPLPKKDLKTIISKFVSDYYSEDNRTLKEHLTSLNWHKFPTKYTSL